MIKLHHWSGWPGAYCLDCGAVDMEEECVALCPIFVGNEENLTVDKTKCLYPDTHQNTTCPTTYNSNCGQCLSLKSEMP